MSDGTLLSSPNVARGVLAAVLAVAAFTFLNSITNDACALPTYNVGVAIQYLIIPAFILLCFLWFVGEIGYLGARLAGIATSWALPLAIATALTVYALGGFVVWMMSPPLPTDVEPNDRIYQLLYSVFWSLGLNEEVNATTNYTCGQ